MANNSQEPIRHSVREPMRYSVSDRLLRMDRQILGLLIFIGTIFVAMSIVSDRFLTYTNLLNVLQQSAFVMIVALGMTFVLTTGGIDLSVGSIIGISGGTTAWMLHHDVNIVLAILSGLIVGGVIGITNGLVITKLKNITIYCNPGYDGDRTRHSLRLDGSHPFPELYEE